MSAGIRLIVGLGNPGLSYEKTRHNAGAWFVLALAEQAGVSFKQHAKFKGKHAVLHQSDSSLPDIHLLLPTTFMNLSGESICALAQYYSISPDAILIAHDDIDLLTGDIRLKFSGGHGGHNGIRDAIHRLRTADFYRLRIGVGHPGHRDQVHDYVLGEPKKVEREVIFAAIQKAESILPSLLIGHYQQATHILHTREK